MANKNELNYLNSNAPYEPESVDVGGYDENGRFLQGREWANYKRKYTFKKALNKSISTEGTKQ